MDDAALAKLQERLGMRFADVSRLERALTHRSAAIENLLESNERLEFLGDSVLGLVVSEILFMRFPGYSEGDLAKSKAYIVSEAALADAALTMGLEEFLVLSLSEAAMGGRRRRSILADAYEALIAAIYLDCGLAEVRRIVYQTLEEALRTAATEQHRRDYKSALQERTQARNRQTPCYRILIETGQEHDKTFTAEALLGAMVIGQGSGKSKKEAEQAAAQDALEKLPPDFALASVATVPENKNGYNKSHYARWRKRAIRAHFRNQFLLDDTGVAVHMSHTEELAADIGVFGGSGFYSLLDNVRQVTLETPFGAPSDDIFLAELDGKRVAFLPRHGRRHTIPPHAINYRANLWAMKMLGVRYLISPCAAGSLQRHIEPEHFVVCDQYVDRTRNRPDTFYDGPDVYHVSSADPYCPHLRRLAIEVIKEHGITVHEAGTVVVIQGPRFSTKAESRWFTQAGWEVISMTQYPEAYLALELNMAVVNIALITDYDSGLVAEGDTEPVTTAEVYAVFLKNAERIKSVVTELIRRIPLDLDSPCHHALDYAKVTA